MKKELFAAMILAVLGALSFWNLHHVNALTSELAETVTASMEMAEQRSWAHSAELAECALRKWHQADIYTHIFIRHSEIEITEEAFGEYLAEVYKNDSGGTAAAYQALIGRLENIYEMEKVTLKSVF